MKYLIILAVLCQATFSPAKTIKLEERSLNCNFTHSKTKTLRGTIFVDSVSERMLFAEVSVIREKRGKEIVMAEYRLEMDDNEELSLILVFKDEEKKVTLSVFGDDMGGMSSLDVGNRHDELTCEVD